MTLNEYYRKYLKQIDLHISQSLKEDHVDSDVTTDLLFDRTLSGKKIDAVLLCKEDCVLAGKNIFIKVFKHLDKRISVKSFYNDGDFIKKGSFVLKLQAPIKILLAGERTSLNYIQRMSGVATLTNSFVKKIKYKGAVVLHTRKTTPGFRTFEIAAVKTGGGDFHRLSLESSVMIKDNHIEALGGMGKTLLALKVKNISQKMKQRLDVEVRTLSELKQVLNFPEGLIQIIMLDNFTDKNIKKALKLVKNRNIKVELSGGINIGNFSKIQYPGIDYYSIGALTHGYKSTDYSLEF